MPIRRPACPSPRPLRYLSVLLLALVLGSAAGAGEPLARLTAGPAPDPDTLASLYASGTRLIIDLRTPAEGVAQEAVAAAEAGIRYVNLPVGREPASQAVMARVSGLVSGAEGGVLLHCASGNRAGEVLARLLMDAGVGVDAALSAGRAAGLKPARESHVIPPRAEDGANGGDGSAQEQEGGDSGDDQDARADAEPEAGLAAAT